MVDFDLPPLGDYGVAQCFLPNDPARREKIEQLLEMNVRVEGQRVLGWRDVPVDEQHVGDTASALAAVHAPAVHRGRPGLRGPTRMAFERKLYVIRRIVELAAGPDFYASSFSSRTLRLQGDADLPPAPALLPGPAPTSASRRRWRSCTRASRRTRSRAGSSRTRTA